MSQRGLIGVFCFVFSYHYELTNWNICDVFWSFGMINFFDAEITQIFDCRILFKFTSQFIGQDSSSLITLLPSGRGIMFQALLHRPGSVCCCFFVGNGTNDHSWVQWPTLVSYRPTWFLWSLLILYYSSFSHSPNPSFMDSNMIAYFLYLIKHAQ